MQNETKPVIITDDTFGDLTFDGGLDWYEAEVLWLGAKVNLRVCGTVDEHPGIALSVAKTLWSEQLRWNDRVRDRAVHDLLELKNDTWLDDDRDEPLTPTEFLDRVTLTSVTVETDGSFGFWFDDGDLFWGHAISVSGTLADGPLRAGISG